MESHPPRPSATGEVPTGTEDLWKQEESHRGSVQETRIAPPEGADASGALRDWSGGVVFLGRHIGGKNFRRTTGTNNNEAQFLLRAVHDVLLLYTKYGVGFVSTGMTQKNRQMVPEHE